MPVRRGAEGRDQALGVQGVRDRLHPGSPDRHLHGLERGSVRRLFQLRSPDAPSRPRRGRGRSCLSGLVMDPREQEVLARIEAKRRRGHVKLLDERVTLSHGAGGKSSHAMIEALFLRDLRNPLLEPLGDSAVFSPSDGAGPRLAFSTDSFVVKPRFFPGGDIGELAINGTVNDLAMSGARPLYLAVALILEEGLAADDLRRVVESMRDAAHEAGVLLVTGDTKVVNRGKGDQVFITTTGLGVIDRPLDISADRARPGDK